MNNKKNYNGDLYVRSRSISEPEISFDKSSINANRFKPKHFPFEYIQVDDLHYYRRRKPCNCKKNLFQSNLCLHSSNRCESLPHLNGRTEYTRAYTEKPCTGRLPALKRPPNLKVDAYPFLTGLYKSDSSLNYQTEYDTNFPLRPFSPRIGMIKRPSNIKLNLGVMDIKSEQKSSFRAYSDDIFSSARPAMIKKPNNLHLTGKIELNPEYRSKFIPYSFDSVYKSNKTPCFHSKTHRRESTTNTHCSRSREKEIRRGSEAASQDMRESRKMTDSHIDMRQVGSHESDVYQAEYMSKYKPVIGKRSSIIQQPCHFQKFNDEFNAVSEYNNRYKTYEQFTKSAPIKKQDNLHMRGETHMQPEYKDRYKEIDYKSYVRQPPLRQQDNLHANERAGVASHQHHVAEYAEQFKDYNAPHPERARGREDYLQLSGDMAYDAEYRNNYVEFPRQRPIVRKPSTHIQLSSTLNDRKERKPDNFSLPIDVPPYHHDTTPAKILAAGGDAEDIPLESTPEYRKAMRNYMLKERSPTRQPTEMELKAREREKNGSKVVDHNDVTKILTENKVNVPEEKIFDENNEVIVEKLKAPSNFKIPTRSPSKLSLGRGASYPIQQDHRFSEHTSTRTIRRPRRPNVDDDGDGGGGGERRHYSVEFADDFDDENNNSTSQFYQTQVPQQVPQQHPQQQQHRPRPKRSPEYGRRAPKPREDYIVRKNTSVIEGNTKYNRNFYPNRHEKRAYHVDHANPLDFAPPSEPLANNYRPNYEIDKQQSYRESLNNNEPFVVLDREINNKVKQQGSWMKKQWYDD